MTREEIVTALRCCASNRLSDCCSCKLYDHANCLGFLKTAAANLIENQQRHIDALMKSQRQFEGRYCAAGQADRGHEAGHGTSGKGCGGEGGRK